MHFTDAIGFGQFVHDGVETVYELPDLGFTANAFVMGLQHD
jgi:hypothetical protein